MSIIHRQKEKHGNGKYDIGTNSIEGTSARTRAFSFEQVMSRRRNKKLDEDAKEEAPSKSLPEIGDYERARHHTGPDSGNNPGNDSNDIIRSSKTREERVSTRKTSPRKHRDKIHQDLEINEKAKSSHEKSSRDKEFKKEKQSHQGSRRDDRPKVDSEKGSSKNHSKVAQIKDIHDGDDGKSLRENKRKHLNVDDEKSRRNMDGFTPKKHDSGKRQDLEPLERRKNQRYEEPRSKRRSRSREYDRGRDRGSVSVSPRGHKRSFHGRDYGESSRSLKDRSGRQYSDADKYRTSGNDGYESGRYRRRGSGLGGYSPRKRRPDAAVIKIPSPTTRSPERKGATWDQPPSEANNSVSGSVPGNLPLSTQNVHDQQPSVPESPAKVKSQRTPPSTSAPAISLVAIDSVHLTQATRPMRRLYVENLPASATDKSIIGCLNGFLLSTGVNHIPGTQPCISCIINKEKCQAVVEFLTPEDATAALSFDGKSFSGFTLKLRRPKDFIDATPTTGAPEPAAVDNTIADVVKDSPDKIFIGGISEYLSSDMLLEIVSVFGLVKAYRVEFNLELNQPCAFLEYVDESITQKACAGLNGMKLGGNVLTVVRALEDTNLGEESDEKPPFYGIPEHARPLLEDPTQVLKLKNVFDPENFLQLQESELEEILEDIRLECARFGTVKSVNVVRYVNRDNATTKAEQDLMDESGKMKSREDTFEGDTNQITKQVPLDDVKETPDTGEVLTIMESIVDNIDDDLENRDSNKSSQVAIGSTHEEPLEPEAAGRELTSENAVVKLEGGHDIENYLVREEPKQVHVNMESGISLAELDSVVPEKCGANAEDGNHQAVAHTFEPGCVLVEFLRKEATCIAAHCLNGRIYDGRMVEVSYAAHNVYKARFPR